MTQDTAHMPLDERAVAEACQAAAIEMARQVGVTLTPAGYRQGAADRPVEQSQMVEYMKAAIRAYLQTAAADVSGLVEEIHGAEWWQRGDENGQVTVSIAPERVAEAYQTLSARNAALEAENEMLRSETPGWVPFTDKDDRMTCRMPTDDSIVEVLTTTGEVIRGWYSRNIMGPGDWDILPVDNQDEPVIDAASLSNAIAWRAAISAPKGGAHE